MLQPAGIVVGEEFDFRFLRCIVCLDYDFVVSCRGDVIEDRLSGSLKPVLPSSRRSYLRATAVVKEQIVILVRRGPVVPGHINDEFISAGCIDPAALITAVTIQVVGPGTEFVIAVGISIDKSSLPVPVGGFVPCGIDPKNIIGPRIGSNPPDDSGAVVVVRVVPPH